MNPAFYKFKDKKEFLENSGENRREYKKDGVHISVVGERYSYVESDFTSDDEGMTMKLVGFLVNTSQPIDAWRKFRVYPTSPDRVFG